MEAALVTAATGALKPVLQKLGALMGDKYKRLKGVRGEIRFLTDELVAMHAFLLVMSEEENPNLQDQVWMTAVRELSYDMEDSIDDFMHSDDSESTPDGFMEKIKHSMGKLGKIKTHRQIGKEIKDMKKQVIEVGDRNKRYNLGIANTNNATVDPRALAMFDHVSKLVGIDEPKAEIIKLLTEQDECVSTQKKLKVVSIVGSGGMGKTTLANLVYQELKGQFNCTAFLSVSRNPNMKNILRTILGEVSGQGYANTEAGSIQQLIIKINDSLLNNRYFIVIDDIWDVDTWNVIKRAFPMSNSSSRIMTTTRVNSVAHSCCSSFSGHIYNIRPLNIVHSRQLFDRRIFNCEENCPSHLEEVCDKIMEKCDGLPLAIIAISGLLANKERTEDRWNQVKDSIGHALERNPSVEGMMKILSLSYLDLPCHLKSCLLYISMFPEDSVIGMSRLIWGWIGEGFIHKEDRYTIHEMGEKCFNELLNRSLIQAVETNRCGKVESCRVHDTILDFIIHKSVQENFVTLLDVPILATRTQSKFVRRLSLQGAKQGISTIPTRGLVLSHVRSLNVFGDSVEIPSLQEFKHMRVLNFENCHQLERHHFKNIARLFHLRCLNLKNTAIRMLPEQIGRLRCLEMLELRHTFLRKLPASIVNLGKLSHLLIDDDVKFPDGIAKMQALEKLKSVIASRQPLDFMWGLGHLRNLRNMVLGLQLDCTNVVHGDFNKAIASSLCKLGTQNLRTLTVYDGSSLLEEPLCLITIERLITRRSAVPEVPKWVSSLRNLQELQLEVEGVKMNDLCILGALPTLLILHLNEGIDSKERLRINGEFGFRFLKIFNYNARYCSVDLIFGTGSMPKLEQLDISYRRVIEAESLDFGIKNLRCLTIVRCRSYGFEYKAVKTAMERAASTHPNHPSLFFTSLLEDEYVGTAFLFCPV